jgi:deoxyribodipyrimidine photo-lyase
VPVVQQRGGAVTARRKLLAFLNGPLVDYAAGANDPDRDTRSGLSPYLHFGHISAHDVFHQLMKAEDWSLERLGDRTGGRREGWWGVSPGAESWLDELITWRELGYNLTSHTDDYDQYESLPEWAIATLEKHTADPREHVYSLEEFAAAQTHDEVWNAAQTQLLREGRIHNYLRMLWGKKILEWSETPRLALRVLIELNNRYALDGRNPNSYSGIFWTLGRFDRPWGPERPIFGTVRYMSSDSTRRKLRLKNYLQRFGPEE